MPRFLPSFGGTPLPLSWGSLGGSGRLVVQAPAIFLGIALGSSLSLPVFADGLRWLRFILGCPPSVASLWRLLPWFFVRSLLACPRGAAVPLDSWVLWCSLSLCSVTCLRSGLCSSSVHDCDVAFPPLDGFAFGLRSVSLPQADAVGFGSLWSARLSCLLTGWYYSFNLGSSSLAWLGGETSTVFLLLCLPLGCGHPLGVISVFCHY